MNTAELIEQLSENLSYATETEMLNVIAELIERVNNKRLNLNRENGIFAELSSSVNFTEWPFGKKESAKNNIIIINSPKRED